MKRIHLFEFMDQRWFPPSLRDCMTEYLGFVIEKSRAYAPLVPFLEKAMEETGENHIIDLGSGSGGGIRWILKELNQATPENRSTGKKEAVTATLTDRYPALESFRNSGGDSETIHYHPVPVDPARVPPELKGFRTLFNSFHHMQPRDAKALLENACMNRAPILVVEANDPGPIQFLFMLLFVPFFVLLISPFIGPYRWSRILFTYLIPLLPFLIVWDGLVSLLRIYSPDEMQELAKGVACDSFVWESGKIRSGASSLLYLLGRPISRDRRYQT